MPKFVFPSFVFAVFLSLKDRRAIHFTELHKRYFLKLQDSGAHVPICAG